MTKFILSKKTIIIFLGGLLTLEQPGGFFDAFQFLIRFLSLKSSCFCLKFPKNYFFLEVDLRCEFCHPLSTNKKVTHASTYNDQVAFLTHCNFRKATGDDCHESALLYCDVTMQQGQRCDELHYLCANCQNTNSCGFLPF